MNIRIEKLIAQCTVQEFSDCTGGYETFDKELFAFLIVKDCALTAGLMEREGRKNVGAQLLDNYGVEE